MLNAGNRRGAAVARCVGQGRERVEDFDVFCAKVLAGIDTGHRLPDTIRDRSITIAMRRRTSAERVERLRWRDADAAMQPIREQLADWAEGAEGLIDAVPDTPSELDDRAADAWEPLLAIADQAGGEWPRRARESAVALSGSLATDEQTIGSLLLGAIREAFADSDRLATADLLDAINGEEELPFGGWRDGRGLDGRALARVLRPYGIRPRTVRLADGSTPKGYLREQFGDAWDRWVILVAQEPPHPPHPPHPAEHPAKKRPDQAVVADVADAADGGSQGDAVRRLAAPEEERVDV
jgi:hypothetical protein